MIPCRVLPHASADGPTNMAVDESLLDWVGADPTHAILRTYAWSEPTLSLGYFQPIALAEADPRWRGVPTVRRPTGGGALWHDRELTFAIALPADRPGAGRGVDLYAAVHGTIAALLAKAGLAATTRGPALPPVGAGSKPFLCFADRDANDVVSGPVKLVGGAQRRRAGAVLLHGALLLARSPMTPELLGVSDLTASPTDPIAWSSRLLDAITAGLGLRAFPDALSDREVSRVDDLARSVYRDPAWTRKR